MKQLEYTIDDKGEELGVKEMRKHFSWYLKGIKNSAKIRNDIFTANTADEIKKIIRRIN